MKEVNPATLVYGPSAVFSPDRRHRYRLDRPLRERPTKLLLAFCCLNPSTADETRNDPTVRRGIGYTYDLGYRQFVMTNLFGWRSTDPGGMWAARRAGEDIVGPDNDAMLLQVAKEIRESGGLFVAAWSDFPKAQKEDRAFALARARRVRELLFSEGVLMSVFGLDCQAWGRLCRKDLAERHRVLIGIAADEADRALDTGRPFYERACYPLLEMKIGKAEEIPVLDRHGLGWLHKSGCYMCPYQPVGWYWVLSIRHPDLFALVVEYERRALEENPKMFVVAGKPIEVAVADWRRRNPRATEDELLKKAYCRGTAGWSGNGKRPEQLQLFA